MHRMSPGVERAVAAGRGWADRLGSGPVRLAHLALALFDDDEGRPAVLAERVGLTVADVRGKLADLSDSPPAPPDAVLFATARDWSLAHRHDPEFLTDAFLLAVLRADPEFERTAAAAGLDADRLETLLMGETKADVPSEPEHPLAVFAGPDVTAEVDAARVLDANFNRAREAARVLDDYCRFVRDDRFLTAKAKELRHGLAAAAARLPTHLLLAARDTVGDVGAAVTAAGEYDRGTPAEVAAVNLKRLQESLRSLEEFGKLFGPDLGRDLEALRYAAYTLERAVVGGGRALTRLSAARLYVLLTGAQCRAALDWTVERAAAGGADVFQLREKDLSDRDLVTRARDVRAYTARVGALFVVNDRPDVARLVGADGVHLGQDDLSVRDARRVVGPDVLIGVSTHTVAQVRRAVLDGADYLGVGPVFPSRTKSFDHFPGLGLVREAAVETTLPAFALGGIAPDNVGRVAAAGARRVAVGAAVAAADDPEAAARLLRAGLG